MGQPAGDPGDGKDRSEQIPGNAELAVHQSRIEIHVGVDAFGAEARRRFFFNRPGDIVEVVMAKAVEHLLHKGLQDHGAWIFHLVFPVAEAHDFALGRNGFIQESASILGASHLLKHGENVFIGTAMEWARKGADG